VSRKCRNWYQNEVDFLVNFILIKGADFRDEVKHTERSDQLFLEMSL